MHDLKSNIKYDLSQSSKIFKFSWMLKFDRGTFTERVEKKTALSLDPPTEGREVQRAAAPVNKCKKN